MSLTAAVTSAYRQLIRRPFLPLLAAGTLALGIGASSSLFSVVDAVLLRPLPYSEPERLTIVWGVTRADGNLSNQVSATDIHDLRAKNKTLEEVASLASWRPVLDVQGEAPERITGLRVSDGFFNILRAKPQLGRLLLAKDQEPDQDVVVLSDALWRRRFGAEPNILGRRVSLNGRSHLVVGVLGPEFEALPAGFAPRDPEVYRPVSEPFDETQRDARHLRAVARVARNSSVSAAAAEVTAISQGFAKEHPNTNEGYELRSVRLAEDLAAPLRKPFALLLGGVALLFAVASANVAQLLLARAAGRRREWSIRAALGASRGRLVRELLAESLLVSLVGGAVGAFFGAFGSRAIAAIGAAWIPSTTQIVFDARSIAFAFFAALIAAIAAGLGPALGASRISAIDRLGSGVRTVTEAPEGSRLHNLLIAAEMAMAIVLLVGAALLGRSVLALARVDLGFSPQSISTVDVQLPPALYPEDAGLLRFFDALEARMREVPGVRSVGLTSVLPLSDNFDGRGLEVEGKPETDGQGPSADLYVATPGYLETLRIPLLRGRGLAPTDRESTPKVALVGETMAAQLWAGESALGQRIRLGSQDEWREVVGVVRDVHQYGLDVAPPMQFYLPLTQMPSSYLTLTVAAQNQAALAGLPANIRREVRALDPRLALAESTTLEEYVAGHLGLRRLALTLLGLFALLAVALAAVGLYGVLSHLVGKRTREIGVRMALGARALQVASEVTAKGLRPAALGLVVGLFLAAAAKKVWGNLLYDISPIDLPTYFGVGLGAAVIALVATVLPARRAAKVPPAVALRGD